jgi:hypothetical protein
MSDQPATLAEALAVLQARLPKIGKDRTARVVTKDKGTYTYDYANLTTISAQLFPLMAALGLSFTCAPTILDGQFVLSYRLGHVTDAAAVTGSYPLPDPVRSTPSRSARRSPTPAVTACAR